MSRPDARPGRRGSSSFSIVGALLGATWGGLFAVAYPMFHAPGAVLLLLGGSAAGGLSGAVVDALIRARR